MISLKLHNTSNPARRIVLAWVSAFLVLLVACPAKTVEPAYIRNDTGVPSEYELKAIYLYNFLQFVQWPGNKCHLHEGRSHQISVLGESPFNDILLALQEKLLENDKDLKLNFYGPYHQGMNFQSCCLLFITESEHEHLPQILEDLTGKPVLTVADTDAFLEHGVMVTLLSHNNKIRWAINRKPVKEAGLRISSKLLSMAVQVLD